MDRFFNEWYSRAGRLKGYEQDPPGPFPVIALEGIDGSGKSTVMQLLCERLNALPLTVTPAGLKPVKPLVDEMAPLPQLLFHLSGLFHVSDQARVESHVRPVVIHRYLASQYVKHEARTGTPIAAAMEATAELWQYLLPPTLTVYLYADHAKITSRLEGRSAPTRDDERVRVDRQYAEMITKRYLAISRCDPRGLFIDTAEMTPEQVALYIIESLAESTVSTRRAIR